MEILKSYQSLISAVIGGLITYFIFWKQKKIGDQKNKYERIFWIYKALLSNSAQIVCFEFVSAFNLILVEFEKDKEVMEAREKFFATVNCLPTEDSNELRKRHKDQEDTLIRLINTIGKRININVEQLDIKNKIYWPQGFNDTASQQSRLMDLLLKNQEWSEQVLEKIATNKLSIGIYPTDIQKEDQKIK